MKICLCGSTNRFLEAFGDWDIILTKAGHVVYSVARSAHGDKTLTAEEKRRFDLMHLKKISESDAIVVLNINGYYGESTEQEIEWAKMNRKDVYWLNSFIDKHGEPCSMGTSIWSLYNLFDGGVPLKTIPETDKYYFDGAKKAL